MVTIRPKWVLPGQQWSSGQTQEQYEQAGGKLAPDVSSVKKIDTEAQKVQIQAGIKEAQVRIGEIQAGVSALAEIDTAGAPPIPTVAGDITAVGAGLISTDTQMQELIKTLTKQSEEAAKRAETAQKGLLATITQRKEAREKMPSVEDVTRTTLAEYGLTPESVQKVQGWMGQLATYNQQIVDLEARKQLALDRQEERPGQTMDFMTREQNRIAKQYNHQITAKAAQAGVVSQQIQMERGLWGDARATANQIVQAATYDQRQELADLDWTRDAYQDLYNMATSEERTAWDRNYKIAQDTLKTAKEDTEKLTDLMLASKGQAGITLEDTYEEAVEKFNTWQAAQPEVGEVLTGADVKMVSVRTPSGFASIPVDVNNITSAAIDQLRKAGMNDKDIRSWLDVNTKLTKGTIDGLLEKEITLADIKASTKSVFQQYKGIGYTRKQVEEQWMADNNATELSPLVEDILDELFPTQKRWWEFWK